MLAPHTHPTLRAGRLPDVLCSWGAWLVKVLSVAWSCDGRRLASSGSDRTVRVFSHIESHVRAPPCPPPRPCTWSHALTMRAQSRGGESYELRGHTDSVHQLCWDPTHPERLATASVDRSVRLWDIRGAARSPDARLCSSMHRRR
jgi:THO complex subunit 3